MQAKPRLHAAPATFASLALVLAFAVVGVVVLGGGKAGAVQQVSCGDTITTDTTLHHNLRNCPNNGIIIGADNVTLDLNYHTIDGDGAPAAGCDPVAEFCDFGVLNDGHDGVAVVHGSIREFAAGLGAFTSRHARLLDISASRNQVVGITLGGDTRILVRNCSGNRQPGGEGTGLGLGESHHVRILNCSFRHNGRAGIHTDDSKNNLVKGNLFSGNRQEAFLLDGGEGFRITHNRVVRNGAGITLDPGSKGELRERHNVVKRNHVFRGREGIRIAKGHGDLVAGNIVVGAHGAGIRLGIRHPLLGGAYNIVRNNLVKGSHVDGFVVGKKDRHSRLRGNTAKRAGDDGFDIASRSATLTGNRANRNGDLGIEAVRGVNDGGGNRARHNGDPRQCTNIACN